MPAPTRPDGEESTTLAAVIYDLAHQSWLDHHQNMIGGALDAARQIDAPDSSFNTLSDKIAWCLDASRDDIIAEAMSRAHRTGADDVANEIDLACEAEASGIVSPDEDGEQAHLFAIPVILYSAHDCPADLESPSRLDAIRDSLLKFDLFIDEPTIKLARHLFTPEQLHGLPYSRVRQLARDILADREIAPDLAASPLRPGPVPSPLSARVHLRYLLLVVVHQQADLPDEDIDEANDLSGEDMVRERAWRDHMTQILAPCLVSENSEDFVAVGILDKFFDGRRAGLVERSNIELFVFTRNLMNHLSIDGAALRAVIAPFGVDDAASEIRIALLELNSGKVRAGYCYPIHPYESVEDALGECDNMMRSLGLALVDTVATVQNAGNPDDPKVFLVQAPEEGRLPQVPFPASHLIH